MLQFPWDLHRLLIMIEVIREAEMLQVIQDKKFVRWRPYTIVGGTREVKDQEESWGSE